MNEKTFRSHSPKDEYGVYDLLCLALDNLADHVFIKDVGGRFVFCNAAYRRDALGDLTLEEVVGKTVFDLLPSEVAKQHRAAEEELVRTGRPSSVEEAPVQDKSGQKSRFSIVRVPLRDAGGRVIGLAGFGRDVTRTGPAEEVSHENGGWLCSVVQNSSEILKVLDPDGTLRYASPAFERVLGYEPGEAVGMNVLEYVHPEDLPGVVEETEKALGEPGVGVNVAEYRFRHADGSWRHLEAVGTYLLEEPGVRGVVVNARDVTTRKQSEAALKESEQRYRAVVEQTMEGIYLCEAETGRVLESNAAFRKIVGYTAEDLDGTHIYEFISGKRADVDLTFRRILDHGRLDSGEQRYRRKDGSEVDVDTSATVISYRDCKVVCVVVRDVTERKEAQRKLREAEDRYRTLVEQVPAVTYIQEIYHNYSAVYVSPQIAKMTGYRPEEFYAERDLWYGMVHPEDRERVVAEDDRTDETGEPFSMEYRLVARDGRVVWVRDEATLLRDEEGKPGYWHGVMVDITERKLVEESLAETEQRYRSLVEKAPAVVYLDAVDETNRAIYRNPRVEEVLGYRAEEFYVPGFWQGLLHPDDRERVLAENERTNRTGEPFRIDYRMIHKSGRVVWLRDEAVLIRDDEGEPLYWQGFFTDITERKEIEDRLRQSEQRLRAITDGAPVVLFALDDEGVFTFEGGAALDDLGVEPGSSVGRSVFEAYSDLPHVLGNVRRALGGERVTDTVEIAGRAYHAVYSPQRDGRGRVSGVIGVATDITERKNLEGRLTHRAFHDSLTSLPNHSLFMELLDKALARAERSRKAVAILFIDLDNFKVVNDSLGHSAGNQLLESVAVRLQTSVRPGDTVARFFGDEFAVLLENIGEVGEAVQVADRIVSTMRHPLRLNEREIFVSLSMGVALAPGGRRDPDELLRNADLAMYAAKEHGKARYEVYHPRMNTRAVERRDLENDLRCAMRREEFMVFYQPVVALDTGEIRQMEALVRWKSPERGLVLPSNFISVAEQSGLIVPIGRWVMKEACRQAREWQDRAGPAPRPILDVNLSARQFFGTPEFVTEVLQETGFDPGGLQLEITERTVMDDAEAVIGEMRRMRSLGIAFAIDDFGTGYSCLQYLKRLPVSSLKIDYSFIEGLADNPEDEAIVSGTIGLGHALGLKVVAEGVSTAEQATLLREMGCDLAQGHYFASPLTGEEASELLAGHPGRLG